MPWLRHTPSLPLSWALSPPLSILCCCCPLYLSLSCFLCWAMSLTLTSFSLILFISSLSLSLSSHHTSKFSLTSRANVSQVLKPIRVFNPFSLNYFDSSFFFFYFQRSLKMKKARTKTKRNKWGQFIFCVTAPTNQPDSIFSLKTKPNFIQVSGFLFREKQNMPPLSLDETTMASFSLLMFYILKLT